MISLFLSPSCFFPTSLLVFARIEVLSRISLVEQVAPLLLNFYGEYFQLPYALPKLDLIAPPESVFNGMENWGLMTFRCAQGSCC